MFAKPCLKNHQLLPLLLLLPFGWALISCTTIQNKAEPTILQATATVVPVEASFTPTSTAIVNILPTEELQEATSTAVPTSIVTKAITRPTLISLEIPLETEDLPAYGWFSEDSQVVHFAYPEDGFTFSYNIAAQQLISSTLSQRSNEELIEQVTADLPANARIVYISPRDQHIFYTTPISQPITLERGAFTVSLGDDLWLYREGGSARLGAVDSCFLINLPFGTLWSPSENFATVNAFASMSCAWNNWLIDLETFTVEPLNQTWEEGAAGYSITAILPDKRLLLTPHLRNESSAVLDLQTQELTIFSNRGTEIAKYLHEAILMDFSFRLSRGETEVAFSPLSSTDWQLIGTVEGAIRAKYVSPDQKHVLLFSGSPDYYGLSEHQETLGVWLLSFP